MVKSARKILNEALQLSAQWEATTRQKSKDEPCAANVKIFSAARILKAVTATSVMKVPLTDVDADLTLRKAKAILRYVKQEIHTAQRASS